MSGAQSPGREARVLEERAQRLRQRKDSDKEDEGLWAADFRMGNDRYCIPLDRLVACMPMKGVTPVPKSRREVLGIMRWEGKVVAVFSLATLMGLKGWRRDPSVLLLLRHRQSIIGIDSEEIPGSLLLAPQVLAEAQVGQGPLRRLALPGQGTSPQGQLQWIDTHQLLDFLDKP
jgi:chemotaxis signal transduction protein